MTTIDYSQKIPNNVDLTSDKRLQRALERWQPGYIEWWREAGPTDYNEKDVYLRGNVGHLRSHLRIRRVEKVNHPRRTNRDLARGHRRTDRARLKEMLSASHSPLPQDAPLT